MERYRRQMILKNFGPHAQKKLKEAKVLVVGAGGLGCPVLLYLTAAGVGKLGIVDDDVVSLHNLHRQVLYRMADIGQPKSIRAEMALKALNPDIHFQVYNTRLTNQNALEMIEEYDLVVDGTDNFPSRYLINDACVLLGKPMVYGAVSHYEGQLAVFNYPYGKKKRVNYRDLFPVPPGEKEVLSCEEGGVLGVLPGIIGSMQANEAIKVITGLGKPLINQLFTYHALTSQSYIIQIGPSAASYHFPETENQFKDFDYTLFCTPGTEGISEINSAQLRDMMEKEDVTLVDIRQSGSIPGVANADFIQGIPIEELKKSQPILRGENIVVVCQAGISSRQTVKELMFHFGPGKRIYSLRGGLSDWNKYLSNSENYGKET